MAPNADLRPFQMAALCSGLWLMRTALGLNAFGDVGDGGEQVGDLLVGALHLHDQQRLHVGGIAGLGERLAHLDRGLVHELDGDGDDAGGDDGGHAVARRRAGAEAQEHGARGLR